MILKTCIEMILKTCILVLKAIKTGEETNSQSMISLYKVVSKTDFFPHKDRIYNVVELRWFVVYRESYSPSHEKAIEYCRKELDDSYYLSEDNLSELFTKEEADAFREYLLRTYKQECEIKEADLTLECYTLGCEDTLLGSEEGFYRLNIEEENYDLPFVVWGYYDVSYSKDVSWLNFGVEFVERFLNKIGMSVTDRDKLKPIIRELRDEGLIVDKGIRQKDKVKDKVVKS